MPRPIVIESLSIKYGNQNRCSHYHRKFVCSVPFRRDGSLKRIYWCASCGALGRKRWGKKRTVWERPINE